MVLLTAFTASVQAQVDVTICNNAPYTIANAASPSNGEVDKYRWFKDNEWIVEGPGYTSYTIPSGTTAGTYKYVRQAHAQACDMWVSSNVFTVQVIAGTTPGVPSATGAARCGAGTVTCTATAPSGGSITWWDAAGNQITFPYDITSTTTFYAQAHSGANGTGCVSASRRAVTATVNDVPVVALATNPTPVFSGNASTLTATVSFGSTSSMSYTWTKVGGSSSTNTTNSWSTGTLTANASYTVTVRNTDGCTGTSGTATVTALAAWTRMQVSASEYYNAEFSQSACPSGWRLPTNAEFQAMINAGYTWRDANSGYGNTENGMFFGSNSELCTTTNGNCIFLPARGGYGNDDGTYGYYWSSTLDGGRFGFLSFGGGVPVVGHDFSYYYNSFNFPVLCVQ